MPVLLTLINLPSRVELGNLLLFRLPNGIGSVLALPRKELRDRCVRGRGQVREETLDDVLHLSVRESREGLIDHQSDGRRVLDVDTRDERVGSYLVERQPRCAACSLSLVLREAERDVPFTVRVNRGASAPRGLGKSVGSDVDGD